MEFVRPLEPILIIDDVKQIRADLSQVLAGLGFDDIIIAEGFPAIAEEFNSNIDLAIDLIDNTDTSLLDQSQALLDSGDSASCENSASNPESVQTVPICSLYGVIKRITDSLRIDFVTIVNLDLPDRAQSDND